MRETHTGYSYKPGDWWRECDECGFDYRKSQLYVRRRDGAIVCKKCLDKESDDDKG